MGAFDLPGRSPVLAENGVVATSHPLASATGLRILQSGGNAIDAAIAAAAVLAVVEPQMTGIGGDGFAIVADENGTLHGVNGSGRSAAAATIDVFRNAGHSEIPGHSVHAVTVPGVVKTWSVLHERFGSLDWSLLFADAIEYAQQGFGVTPRVAFDWAKSVTTLGNDPAMSRIYLKDGKTPHVGDRIQLPELAATLRTIATEGASGFYEGAVAKDIVTSINAKGGVMTEEDLAAMQVDLVTPVSTEYSGHELIELPPNGQGLVALILMNLTDLLGVREHAADSVERYHLEIEAARIAYSVRDAYLADPLAMRVPVDQLISKSYARSLVGQIDPEKRNPDIKISDVPNADTIYLTVADRDGRMISLINSIYNDFGSQIATQKSGIVLQNRGACFNLIDGHPNVFAGGKLPMHTIIPAMVSKGGRPAISFGVMGGAYQPMGHTQVLGNVLDHGMNPQEAIDHPRLFWDDAGAIKCEAGISETIYQQLADKGHRVVRSPLGIGGSQMIAVDHERGFYIAGSDPRKDGLAIGY